MPAASTPTSRATRTSEGEPAAQRSVAPQARAARRLERMTGASKAAGMKLTHQRLEIFKELAAADDHPSVERIFRAVKERVPTVSLDTVYRTLWTLHDLALVSTLGAQSDGVRFDTNTEPHHHFVCTRCGLVRDFVSTPLNHLPLPATVKAFGTVLDAHIEVRGVCAVCGAKRRPRAKTKPRMRPPARRTRRNDER